MTGDEAMCTLLLVRNLCCRESVGDRDELLKRTVNNQSPINEFNGNVSHDNKITQHMTKQ